MNDLAAIRVDSLDTSTVSLQLIQYTLHYLVFAKKQRK
jgi:hypothetical protein